MRVIHLAGGVIHWVYKCGVGVFNRAVVGGMQSNILGGDAIIT